MSDYFPTNVQDEVTKSLLDKNNRVEEHDNKPKFIPYDITVDDETKHISPLTDFMYYRKLPQVYRDYDNLQNKTINPATGEPFEHGPLYRFLQSLFEGGYAELVYNTVSKNRGIDNLLELIDPQTCPSEFLPLYCESLGITWFQDLVKSPSEGVDPYYYMRTFLCNYGEICKRRGTESVAKYIAKVLTSKDVKLKYDRTIRNGETQSRILWVELQINSPEEVSEVKNNSEIIQRFISSHLPYYLTSRVMYVKNTKNITIGGYTANAVSKVKRTTIVAPALYPAGSRDFIYTTINNEVYLLNYIGTETRISVPKRIDGHHVVAITKTCFGYNSDIEYVKLPNTIRIIE